jgi:hypothetical protein
MCVRILLAAVGLFVLPGATLAGDFEPYNPGESARLQSDLFYGGAETLYSPLSHAFMNGQSDLLRLDRPFEEIDWGGGRGLLWHDPEQGLVGAIASYLRFDSQQYYRFGAEGEWYSGPLTAAGRAGYLEGDITSVPFASLDLRWYATDNLLFEAGGEQVSDVTFGKLRFEYQPEFTDLNGLSFFARAAGSTDENNYIFGGVRYYFGGHQTLIHRHRGQPQESTLDSLFGTFDSLRLQR